MPAFEEQRNESMTATIEIRAPSEQTDGTRSQVQRWLKSVGDSVAENEPLIELETDKVTIEIPAPAAGVLAEILKQEQDEIAPGELLGRIESGAQTQATAKSAPAPESAHAPAIDDVTTAALSAHAAAISGGAVAIVEVGRRMGAGLEFRSLTIRGRSRG